MLLQPIKEDSYTCPQCSLAPKIINLYRDKIILECVVHGRQMIEVDQYMESSSKRVYSNQICGICNKTEQKSDDNIFKYCYDCDKVICYQCINTHQKNNEKHTNIIPADLYITKCNIHKGEDYQEFCYTCNKNICKKCFEEHKDHEKEKLEGLDQELLEGDIVLIDARKQYLETIREKMIKQIKEVNDCINFYDLILKTQKKYGYNNAYYVQNVEIVARDLDAQYEYVDKNKRIEELKKWINEWKKLDQVKDKLLEEFNKKYNTTIKKEDTKIDLTGKNIKTEGLRELCNLNLENVKELILSKNNITSLKALYETNIDNLEILKVDNNRLVSIEIFPFLKCFKLKELHLNENKLCNIESLNKLPEDFKSLEFIDLRNNYFDIKLEDNDKLIKELEKKYKNIKLKDDANDEDEELKELMKSKRFQ